MLKVVEKGFFMGQKLTHQEQQKAVDEKCGDGAFLFMVECISDKDLTLTLCRRHDIVWETTANSLKRGYGCYECGKEKAYNKNIQKAITKDEWEQRIGKKHGNSITLLDLFYYKRISKRGLLQCNICYHKWVATLKNTVKEVRPTGCPNCKRINASLKQLKSIQQNQSDCDRVHGIGHYTIVDNAHTKVKTKVFDTVCKNTFYIRINDLLNGYGCNICSLSSEAQNIFYFLKKQIEIPVLEKKFTWSDNKLYDFYLPYHGILIEYHGEQHYRFTRHWHISVDEFLKRQKIDKWKKEQAVIHGYTFIEVPYYVNTLEYLKEQLSIYILYQI